MFHSQRDIRFERSCGGGIVLIPGVLSRPFRQNVATHARGIPRHASRSGENPGRPPSAGLLTPQESNTDNGAEPPQRKPEVKEYNVRVGLPFVVSRRGAVALDGARLGSTTAGRCAAYGSRHSLAMLLLSLACLGAPIAAGAEEKAASPSALRADVEAEEDVYSFSPANNGAGPLWCHGSTCLVRIGANVFASGLETLKDAKPLNNCRWTLYARGTDGWQLQQVDAAGRTREPCPVVTLPGGKLLLSVNPTLVTDANVYSGPARPEILQFSAENPKAPFATILPAWNGKPKFAEHSYRSFAADGQAGTLILFQNIGYTHAEWTFRDGDGRWAAQGKLVWPWGDTYDKPEPIRVCYPNVAIRGRAVHFCGVSDVVEPYQKWRDYKRKLTGQQWDYDFRRLFYTWTDDVTSGTFQPWVEIASRDKTCGWIQPGDLWLAADGSVHILWNERAIDERLRKEFFPDQKQSHLLQYAVLRAGKIVSQRTLLAAEEGGRNEVPGMGRFHVTPDGRLFAFYYVSGSDASGKAASENRLMELRPDGSSGPAIRVPLAHPFGSYFTATPRAGSLPSTILDVFGVRVGSGNTMSYARIKLR
jgi:hypothetical protein